MKHIVIDPRRRVRRAFFLYDLILPNVGALVLILVIRILDLGLIGDVAIGAIAALLLWSGNIAAPMARMHDLGVSGLWHLAVVVAVFYLSTVGLDAGPGEAVQRLASWTSVRLNGGETLEASGSSRFLGGVIALAEVGILCFVPGQRGTNRYGPDPREKPWR